MVESPGLPFPQALGAHIEEMRSRPSLKTPALGRPGKLSQADSQHFCCLAMVPTEEELATFEDKTKTLGLVTPTEYSHPHAHLRC